MINIVFASDDNYFGYLYVALYSLLENNRKETINLFILDDKIKSEKKEKVSSLINNYENKVVNFIDISNIVNDYVSNDTLKSYLRKNYSTTYARLFLDFLLPPEIEKVLYLDCDILVNGNLKELWDIDISDYYVAGVLDLMPNVYKEVIGLNADSTYLNAGILLINVKKCRNEGIWNKFFEFLKQHINEDIHHDQGIINGVCKDKMLVIHPKYNYIGSLHIKKPTNAIKWFVDQKNFYDNETIDEAKNNTVIYHFCEGSLGRPWYNNNHMYYNLYREYVLKSKIDENTIYTSNYDKSLFNKLYLFLQTNTLFSIMLKLIPAPITRNITNKLLKLNMKN